MYNVYYLHTNKQNKAVFKYNIALSTVIFLYVMDRLFTKFLHPYEPRSDEITSAVASCTYQGLKHLYWVFDLGTNKGLELNYSLYMLTICMPAFWVDSTRHALFLNSSFTGGLIMSYLYTQNWEETLSFWCILSIPFLLTSYLPYLNLLKDKARVLLRE